MLRIFNVIFVLLCMCYPLVLYFSTREVKIIFLGIIGICWFIKYLLNKAMLSLSISIVFLLMIIINLQFYKSILEFLYPALINFLMLFVFANSLKDEAIITKIAKMKNPSLDSSGIIYTRRLTKLWCYLFSFNGIVALALALFEEKIYWSVFCGIISYILVGILFSGEFLYRVLIFKRGSNGVYK